MTKQVFTVEKDGFYGAWYPLPGTLPGASDESLPGAGEPEGSASRPGIILMLGDSAEDRMAVSAVKWVHGNGCHALAMAPAPNDYGHHNYPLERFEKAIAFMKEQGCEQIGIVGASTTGMLALIAASYYPEITLTVAVSPSDFVMEGFYRDGKDGMTERPGDGESSVSWRGEPLPYLPYAYRHPEYWLKIKEESKAGGDFIASRKMFEESERRHPLREEEKIKVERIRGKVVCIGAEDDVLWNTCRYIRRMQKRLSKIPHECDFEAWLYAHGTHFAFPESMLKTMLPVGSGLLVSLMFKAGRKFPKECKETRIDIDRRLTKLLENWQNEAGR